MTKQPDDLQGIGLTKQLELLCDIYDGDAMGVETIYVAYARRGCTARAQHKTRLEHAAARRHVGCLCRNTWLGPNSIQGGLLL